MGESFRCDGFKWSLSVREVDGRILRPVIRDVKRKAGRVSDDGESSQLAGIGHQTTLTSAQPMRFTRWPPQWAEFTLGLSYFRGRLATWDRARRVWLGAGGSFEARR